jgi:hypothetical protein
MLEILKLNKTPSVRYSFRVNHKFLNSSIGDVVKIVHPAVMVPEVDLGGGIMERASLGIISKVAKSETSVSLEVLCFQYASAQ